MAKFLMEHESKKLLEGAGIATTGCEVATSQDEAVEMAKKIGFPVVLKVLSPDIIHKSDVGGVKLGLASEEEVKSGYDELIANAKKVSENITGIGVQRMADPGVEIIIGMTKDPQFGPALMFGLGGVFVEILKDVSFRIVPIESRDADEMIKEIKGFPMLEGYRGSPPADLDKIRELLLSMSKFVTDHPEIDEIDLNPVFAYPDSVLVADARVITGE
ncbi:MAG: acetate--CoA ligase family protein [Halobacteriota archaeon]|nr:acetate--CoA ligase family protein [Halobacteriota archaeon]